MVDHIELFNTAFWVSAMPGLLCNHLVVRQCCFGPVMTIITSYTHMKCSNNHNNQWLFLYCSSGETTVDLLTEEKEKIQRKQLTV